MYDLKGKIVLVTGGTSGIGLSCAKVVLQAGAHGVSIVGTNKAKGKTAEKELITEYGCDKVMFIKTDVTKRDQLDEALKATISKWKTIDILINNAGINNDKQYELEIATNILSIVHGTLLGLQYMDKSKSGRGGVIVNMCSVSGLEESPLTPIYTGTKHFVLGFSRSMGTPHYYDRSGVKIVIICPGYTITSITNNSLCSSESYLYQDLKDVFVNYRENFPKQTPDSVAAAVITSITKGENGSVWVAEDSEHYEIVLPDRKTLRK